MNISVQSLLVVASSLALIGALALFFGRTLYGKALRATAVNRAGARLVGISPDFAGALTFTLAALLCAFSRRADRPDHDDLLRLRLPGRPQGLRRRDHRRAVAAIRSPRRVHLLVGLIESFSSFWASAFKEVIVFTLIIPVLLWRSLTTTHHEEDE